MHFSCVVVRCGCGPANRDVKRRVCLRAPSFGTVCGGGWVLIWSMAGAKLRFKGSSVVDWRRKLPILVVSSWQRMDATKTNGKLVVRFGSIEAR